MPYTINIPAATDFISASQPLIQQNFTELQTWASVDHSPLAGGVGYEGFHFKTTFVPQGAPLTPAIPTFPATYPGLFAANPVNVAAYPAQPQTATNELFISLADGFVFPLTAAQVANSSFPVGNPDGYFFLPGGILIKYNVIDTPVTAPAYWTYTYTVANNIPVFAGGAAGNPANPITFLQQASSAIAPDVRYFTSVANALNTNTGFHYTLVDSASVPKQNWPLYFISIGTMA